jgi:hypothetical protein
VVPVVRVELTCLAAVDFESTASTISPHRHQTFEKLVYHPSCWVSTVPVKQVEVLILKGIEVGFFGFDLSLREKISNKKPGRAPGK